MGSFAGFDLAGSTTSFPVTSQQIAGPSVSYRSAQQCHHFNGIFCEREATRRRCPYSHPPLGQRSANYTAYDPELAAAAS